MLGGGGGGGGSDSRGGGKALGGSAQAPLTDAERRARMLAAAEKRAQSSAGPNVSAEAQAKAKEARTKDELIGKIAAQCTRLGQDVPFGLNQASNDALRKRLETLRGR